MRKAILLFTLLLSLSIIAVSCKDSKKEAETEVEQTDHVVEKAEIAMNDAYICIMNCEEGKTYDKVGKCPVCNMDLKKVEKEEENDSDHHESEEHEHDN